MEAIKNAIGLGSSQVQSGQEPVSGVTGSGTVSEPYDAGNAAGQSGLATDETAKETTSSNTYSTSDTGNQKDTLADQLSSTSTGNASVAGEDRNISRGNGQDSTDSPNVLGQSESLNSVGSTLRQMSDTAAARLLSEQNLIFSNDSLSPQERIYQLYMLLLRYDQRSETSIPETPNATATTSNTAGGAIQPFGGPFPDRSSKVIEEQPGVDHSYQEPVEAQSNIITEDKIRAEEMQASAKASGTVPGVFGSVVHDDSEVLHAGQDEKEEINVPVAGAEQSRADITAGNINGSGESEAYNNVGTGDAYTQSTGSIGDGGVSEAASVGTAPEPDYLREEKRMRPNSGAQGVPATSDGFELSEPTKKSRGQKIKEKLHIGKK